MKRTISRGTFNYVDRLQEEMTARSMPVTPIGITRVVFDTNVPSKAIRTFTMEVAR